MAHHQPKVVKSRPLQFIKQASSQFEIEPKKYHRLRVFLLLLLMLSAAFSVLRLQQAATSSHSSSSLIQPSAATSAVSTETSFTSGKESLKTHISSTTNNLQAHEHGGSNTTSLSCSEFINGRITSSRTRNEGFLCCDRSHQRTDVCYLKGDIRTNSDSSSILLYGTETGSTHANESIRPYTRKWEISIMSTIDEITLRPIPIVNNDSINVMNRCDVHHNVPAIVFSAGGYTGNVYHEFNDGLIPLFITAERFKGEVVLVVSEYHSWWKTRYRGVMKKISNYKMVDFTNDSRVHCFPEMIVGLQIHGELTVDPKLMHEGKGIKDFQSLLAQGFISDQSMVIQSELSQQQQPAVRPKLAIFIRNKSRMLQNLRELIKICKKVGFDVQILNPRRTTPLSDIYAVLNSSHAMLAVHGAAMTHFLFMQPGSVLIQIVPLGLDWAAQEYYGEPARKLGLYYIAYKVSPDESSLYRQYGHRSAVIRDPDAITSRGWPETKKIYLDRQNVRLNLRKFSRLITKAHSHIVQRLHEKIDM